MKKIIAQEYILYDSIYIYSSRTIKLIGGDRSQYSDYLWGGRVYIDWNRHKETF